LAKWEGGNKKNLRNGEGVIAIGQRAVDQLQSGKKDKTACSI
jgi:hypothetical protein